MNFIEEHFTTKSKGKMIYWYKKEDIFHNVLTGDKEESYRLDFSSSKLFGSIYPDLIDNTWNVCYGMLKNPFETELKNKIEKGFKSIKEAMISINRYL